MLKFCSILLGFALVSINVFAASSDCPPLAGTYVNCSVNQDGVISNGFTKVVITQDEDAQGFPAYHFYTESVIDPAQPPIKQTKDFIINPAASDTETSGIIVSVSHLSCASQVITQHADITESQTPYANSDLKIYINSNKQLVMSSLMYINADNENFGTVSSCAKQ